MSLFLKAKKSSAPFRDAQMAGLSISSWRLNGHVTGRVIIRGVAIHRRSSHFGKVHRSSSGGTQEELVPRLVGALALAGKKVVGVAAGDYHTVVWTPWGVGPVGSWAPEDT